MNLMFEFMCWVLYCLLQLESIPVMVQGVWSEDPNSQLESTTQFRKLLSIGMAAVTNKFFKGVSLDVVDCLI